MYREHNYKKLRIADGSVVRSTEKVCDGNKNDCAESGGRERVQKAAAENSEFHKNPAANVGPDQSQNNVGNTAKTAAAPNLSREPSGNQSKEKPRDKAMGFKPDPNRSLRYRLINEHEASYWEEYCI
jgi:hypothetical protein